MPAEGFVNLSVRQSLHGRLDVIRKERQRELGIDSLSWEQFLEMMVTHWERAFRDSHKRGRGKTSKRAAQ